MIANYDYPLRWISNWQLSLYLFWQEWSYIIIIEKRVVNKVLREGINKILQQASPSLFSVHFESDKLFGTLMDSYS